MVFEFARNLVLASPLEFYTAVIATLGVAFWVIDRRSMKAALKAATNSEVTAFRLERQKTEASVERSFAAFQMKCQTTRDAWKNHNWLNGPRLGSMLNSSEEQNEILRVERAGKSLVDRFKESAPKLDSNEIDELEAYFVAANRTSLDLTRLASQLPEPKKNYH